MQATVLRARPGPCTSGRTIAAPRRTVVQTRAFLPANVVMELAERTGTVDAPISTAVGIGIVIALAGTALVPIWLKSGQEAADEIFDRKGVTKTSVKKGKK